MQDNKAAFAPVSIMEKTLEQIVKETDEWLWLRLSDSVYFPSYDSYGSHFAWMYVCNIIKLAETMMNTGALIFDYLQWTPRRHCAKNRWLLRSV